MNIYIMNSFTIHYKGCVASNSNKKNYRVLCKTLTLPRVREDFFHTFEYFMQDVMFESAPVHTIIIFDAVKMPSELRGKQPTLDE